MTDIPYGYCHCGCGGKTNIAKLTNSRLGHKKGEPVFFLAGHGLKPRPRQYAFGDTVPSGVCRCGCGGKTSIAKKSNSKLGHINGQHVPFIRGHRDRPGRYIDDGRKVCTRCMKALPVQAFNKRAVAYDGLAPHCNACNAQRWRDAYYRDIRASRLRAKRWREQNPDKASDIGRRWRARNPELVRNIRRATRAKKPELYRFHCRNRAHRRRANGGRITAAEWQSILDRFNGKCAKCGSPENIHMDHVVPLAKGGAHSIDNVQPLCATCNLRKGTKTEDYRGKMYQPLSLPLDNDT